MKDRSERFGNTAHAQRRTMRTGTAPGRRRWDSRPEAASAIDRLKPAKTDPAVIFTPDTGPPRPRRLRRIIAIGLLQSAWDQSEPAGERRSGSSESLCAHEVFFFGTFLPFFRASDRA